MVSGAVSGTGSGTALVRDPEGGQWYTSGRKHCPVW